MKALGLADSEIEVINEAGIHAYPREACGLIAGIKSHGSWHAKKIYPLINKCDEYTFDRFVFDAEERLETEKKIAGRNLQLIGFFHSHPDQDAYFSHTDLINTEEYQFGEPWLPPSYVYLVLSVKQGKPTDMAAFKILEGQSVRIQINHESLNPNYDKESSYGYSI